MIHIFISYSKHDKHLAGAIKRGFEQNKEIKCFVAHDDIEPGSEWGKEILKNLRTSNFFMPIQTPKLVESYWCQQEAGICLELEIGIIPLIPDQGGVDPVGFYSKYQGFVIKTNDIPASVNHLIQTYDLLNESRRTDHKSKTPIVRFDEGRDDALSYSHSRFNQFKTTSGSQKYYFLSATPMPLLDDFIDTNSKAVQKIIKQPEYDRPHGWNVSYLRGNPILKPFFEGIEKKATDCTLRVFRNGYLEFCSVVDYNFSHAQGDEEYKKQPRFNPYAIIEYPMSFFRLLKEIKGKIGLPASSVVRMAFINCGKYQLGEGHPDSMWHLDHHEGHFADLSNLVVEKVFDDLDMGRDVEAFYFVERLYNAFGLSREAIPFFDNDFICQIGVKENSSRN